MSVSVTFDRTSLGLAPLTIAGEVVSGAGVFVAQGGFVEPDFEPRYSYAPESNFYGGTRLLAAVAAGGSWPLAITIRGSSETDMATRRALVDAAATQFLYDLTITRNGRSRIYAADYSIPKWDAGSYAQVDAFVLRGSLVIPINPKGA